MNLDNTFYQLDRFSSELRPSSTVEEKNNLVNQIKELVKKLESEGVFKKEISPKKLGILSRVKKSLVDVDQGVKPSYFRAPLGLSSGLERNALKQNIEEIVAVINTEPKALADMEESKKIIKETVTVIKNKEPRSKELLLIRLNIIGFKNFENALECVLFNGLKMEEFGLDADFINEYLELYGKTNIPNNDTLQSLNRKNPGVVTSFEKSGSLLLEIANTCPLKHDVMTTPNLINAMTKKILEVLEENHSKKIDFLRSSELKELISEKLRNKYLENQGYINFFKPNEVVQDVVINVLSIARELEEFESKPVARSNVKRLFTDSNNACSVSLRRGKLDVFSSYAENTEIYDRAIYDGDRLFGVADGCEHIEPAGRAAQMLIAEMGSEDMKLPENPTPENMNAHYAKFLDKFMHKGGVSPEAQSTCLYGQKKTYNKNDPHLNQLLRPNQGYWPDYFSMGPRAVNGNNVVNINNPETAESVTFVSLLSVGDCGSILIEKATGKVIPLFDPEPDPVNKKPSALPQMDRDQLINARIKHFLIGNPEKYTLLTFSDGITDGIVGRSFEEKCETIQELLSGKIDEILRTDNRGTLQITSEGIHQMIKDEVVKNTADFIKASKDIEQAKKNVENGYAMITQLPKVRHISNIKFENKESNLAKNFDDYVILRRRNYESVFNQLEDSIPIKDEEKNAILKKLEPHYIDLKLSEEVKSELNNKLTEILSTNPIDKKEIFQEILKAIPDSSYSQDYVEKTTDTFLKQLKRTKAHEWNHKLNDDTLDYFMLFGMEGEELRKNQALVDSIIENKRWAAEIDQRLIALHDQGIAGDDCTLLSVDLSPAPVTDKKDGPFPSGLELVHYMLTRIPERDTFKQFFRECVGAAEFEMGGMNIKKEFTSLEKLQIKLKEVFRENSVTFEKDMSAENIARLSLIESTFDFNQAYLMPGDDPQIKKIVEAIKLPEDGKVLPPNSNIEPPRCFWNRNQRNTIIVRIQIHPVVDEDGLIIAYKGIRRETTISNKDLAKSWVGSNERPPSLKVKTTCIADYSLSVVREELGLNPNPQRKKEAKPLEAGPKSEEFKDEDEDPRARP
jgi:hypothetical protein